MAASIRHRGPDHTGFHEDAGVLLGNNRLSIIDLDGGNQPMYNETEDLVIVFNGEIYNYRDLRRGLESKGHTFRTRSDTEVIIHAFEEYGAECVDHLDGMFAFAIWDRTRRDLFLARDPLGIKPLYVMETDQAFAFASEPTALLGLMDGGPGPDWTAINRFFSFGYFPSEDCAFEGIDKFPPGHVATLRARRLEKTRYWRPAYAPEPPTPFGDTSRRLMALAERVVAKELESDVPVGVFLSGGLDSSLVALSISRLKDSKVPSFSLGFDEGTHDESRHAQTIADHLGLEHFSYRMSPDELAASLSRVNEKMDEPFGDSTVLPLLVLSEFARKHVKVALTGWGGDELFAGYPTYKAHQLARLYRRLPQLLRDRLVPAVVDALPVSDRYMSFEFKAKKFVQGMNLTPELQHLHWMGYFDDAAKTSLFKAPIRERIGGDTYGPLAAMIGELADVPLVDRMGQLDVLTFLEGNGLFQADRISMAASLEARVPLLNRDMVAFAAGLPAAVKMKGGALKAVFRDALRPHLPGDILNLPKKGFGPPSAAWLRGIFRQTVAERLSKERIEAAGVFEYGPVRDLVDDHMAKRRNNGRTLWLLMSFQLWYDKYFA